MRKGINAFLIFISFFVGCLLTYFILQYTYFQINTEINVVETLLSVITALIGLYIAISIQRRYNRNQSLYSIAQTRVDYLWERFSSLEQQLINQNTIQLNIATKSFKNLYKDLENLKVIFEVFKLDNNCLSQLERRIDEFNDLITGKLPVSKNIIDITKNKSEIKDLSSKTHGDIVLILKKVNEIL